MNHPKRHTGIDLMRIVCMFIIVMYHIQGHGGLIASTQLSAANRVLVVALQSVYQAAVNGYALVSGYVGYQARHRYSSLVVLWLRVLFYSVGVTALVWLISPAAVSRAEIRNAFLPLLTGQYWYFTAYAGCFVLAPLVRAAIAHLSKAEAVRCLVCALFLFSFLPYLLRNDPFFTASGNHALWLTLLYAVGACINRHNLFARLSAKKLSVLLLGACAVQMSAGFLLQQVSRLLTGKATTLWYFICHDSPTTAVLSILILAAFIRIRPALSGRLFRMLALSSFSVYLIHDHPLIRRCVIIPLGAKLAALPSLWVIPSVILSGMAIYLICSLIDTLREAIFSWLRIQERLSRLEDRLFPSASAGACKPDRS